MEYRRIVFGVQLGNSKIGLFGNANVLEDGDDDWLRRRRLAYVVILVLHAIF